MVFDMNNPEAQALLAKLEAATAENASVVKEFDQLIKSGLKDSEVAAGLTKRMEASRIKIADLNDLLQPFRLDS